MLQRLRLGSIKLPRLYIAENSRDVELAKSKGIPFIRWSQGQEMLIKILLRPALERLYPWVNWNKVLGPRRRFKTEVTLCQPMNDVVEEQAAITEEPIDWEPKDSDDVILSADEEHDDDGNIIETSGIAASERLFNSGQEMVAIEKLPLDTYVGDLSAQVNLEVLQKLHLMPQFVGDILDCIKTNIGNGLYWREGYNKRRALLVGRYDAARQLPNLIILDVSGSIPRGISATMIALIDTLRSELDADLIITSTNSRYYPMGTELPSPEAIRSLFGYGNESHDFFYILANNIRGRHWGHVISFGDNDTPYYDHYVGGLEGTVVEHVHHFHTGKWCSLAEPKTGYAKWCHMLATPPEEEYRTDWVSFIKD